MSNPTLSVHSMLRQRLNFEAAIGAEQVPLSPTFLLLVPSVEAGKTRACNDERFEAVGKLHGWTD